WRNCCTARCWSIWYRLFIATLSFFLAEKLPSAHYDRGCESRYFLRINGYPRSSYDMGSIGRSTGFGRSRLMMLFRACRQESWFILFAEVDRLSLLMGVSATTLLRSSLNGVQAILVLFAVTLFSALPARSEDLALRIDQYLKTRVANNQFSVKVLVARGDDVLIRRE